MPGLSIPKFTDKRPEPLRPSLLLYDGCACPVHVCDPLRQIYCQSRAMGTLYLGRSYGGPESGCVYISIVLPAEMPSVAVTGEAYSLLREWWIREQPLLPQTQLSRYAL